MWGETAAKALDKAVEAFKAVVELQVLVAGLVKNTQAFEERVERRCDSAERRMAERVDYLERRLLEAEGKINELRGLVSTVQGEAARIVLERQFEAAGHRVIAPAAADGVQTPGAAAIPQMKR